MRSPFSPHPDAALDELYSGTLRPALRDAVLRHLRGCARCQVRCDRLALAYRALAGGGPEVPSRAELRLLREAHLPAVLAGLRGAGAEPEVSARVEGAPAQAWARRFDEWRAGLLVGASAVAAVTVALVMLSVGASGRAEAPASALAWQARGAAGGAAVLRVFCSRPVPGAEAAMVELDEARSSCPVSGTLAFAVGARAPLDSVRLEVRGAGVTRDWEALAVDSVPGKEQPLEVTVALASAMAGGVVEVAAHFGVRADAAAGGRVVLQRKVQVVTEP
jgi:hypothetical protein